jgi:hypothetical protein
LALEADSEHVVGFGIDVGGIETDSTTDGVDLPGMGGSSTTGDDIDDGEDLNGFGDDFDIDDDCHDHGFSVASTPEYRRFETYQSVAEDRAVYIDAKMANFSPAEKQAHIDEATDAIGQHQTAYDTLFKPWASLPWIAALKACHDAAAGEFVSAPAQPNPWSDSTSSKNYLIKLLPVFEGTSSTSPTTVVERVCMKVVDFLGPDVIEFRQGPIKKKGRIFEKRLMQQDGRFDLIRDYARCYIVIKKGHASKMVQVQTMLAGNPEVKMVRAKNRFDPDQDPTDSGGYRDYQMILQLTEGGWLVEVQMIPEEMLTLKNSLAHGDYTKYRFLLEAKKRAAASSGKVHLFYICFASFWTRRVWFIFPNRTTCCW